MASPTLLLAQYLGLDAYDLASAELALNTLLRLRQIFPARQSCIIGGMAVVHYVGKQMRLISPDVDLLVSIKSQKLIERHFRTKANNFGVTIDCGAIAIDCIATADPMEQEIIATSRVVNMAGSLMRVASIAGMLAMKFKAGRAKDLEDFALLLSASTHSPGHESNLATARNLIQRFHEDMAEDFESELLLGTVAMESQIKAPKDHP